MTLLSDELQITYINGPTVLLELSGLRIVTDPTFDPKGTSYTTNEYVLHKLSNPALSIDQIGQVDIVLLSHDQHFDNLDKSGRNFLPTVPKVYTTKAGSERLGGNSRGLEIWETVKVPLSDGRILLITATPCQHGPAGKDRGPVIGFMLHFENENEGAVYLTGDTVWYEGIAEVSTKFNVKLLFLFMGAAAVQSAGLYHLTMTTEDGIQAAQYFPDAKIIPVHFDGWEHYIETREIIQDGFDKAGFSQRVIWLSS